MLMLVLVPLPVPKYVHRRNATGSLLALETFLVGLS